MQSAIVSVIFNGDKLSDVYKLTTMDKQVLLADTAGLVGEDLSPAYRAVRSNQVGIFRFLDIS